MPTENEPNEAPQTFTPAVRILKEGEDVYDVEVKTYAPNSCFEEAGYALEMPPGADISIPEYEHLVCNVKFTGSPRRMCQMYMKELSWDCQDVTIGSGKSHLFVHIVVEGILMGSTAIKLPGNAELSVAGIWPWPDITGRGVFPWPDISG